MAGIVVSRNGIGGITVNIPLQFDVFTWKHRVITDGFANVGGDATTSTEVANMASSISIPPALMEVLQTVESETAGLLGDVLPTAAQVYDAATNTFVTAVDGSGNNRPFTEILDNTSTSLSGAVGNIQDQVETCTEALNNTVVSSMNQLNAIVNAADFGAAKTAAAAFPPPNLQLGGVTQAAQQLDKFSKVVEGIKGTTGDLGSAISQIEDVANNASMISAMGNLASGVASAMGVTLPNTVDEAFQEITGGEIAQHLNIINTGMAVVDGVASLGSYSGQLDDINDLVWQGSFSESGLALPFLGVTVPRPTWTNTLPCGGTTDGKFPVGANIGGAIEMAKQEVMSKVTSMNTKLDAAIKPLRDLGNASAMISQLGVLPDTLRRNVSSTLLSKAEAAFAEMYPGISLTVPDMPAALSNPDCDPDQAYETVDGGGGGSGTGGSLTNFNIASNSSGNMGAFGHGTVWKPASEKDHNLVVLLASKWAQGTVTISGNGHSDTASFSGFTNGNRGTYRVPRAGSDYGSNATITVTGTDGTATVTGINGANRQG